MELATLPSGSRSRLKKLRFFLIFLALLLLGLVSFAFGMFMAVASDLPGLEDQQQYNNARNSVLLDDRGREIGVLSRQNQILVTPQQIPPIVKEAVISIEDKRFMTNSGVDLRSTARAFVDDLLHHGAVQGASTIEQQFVKNALQEQAHRTIFEKLREAALAFHLAHKWSKEKIITEYLNTIYFGNGAYGIEAAARTYFGQDVNHQGCGTPKQRLCVEELEPWEAALLAGIIQSPTGYNPVAHPAAARARRDVVLEQMLQQGYITRSVYETSVQQPLPAPRDIAAPNQPLIDGIDTGYFDAWVGQQVVDRYHAGTTYDGGLQIKTTLDLELQRAAEQAIGGYLASPEGPGAALVAIENSTGKVRAMVGGRDYNQSPFNLATEGERQPGSSFKAFDLAAALEDGISPSSVWTSKPKTFKTGGEVFVVHNDEDAYTGESTLTNATAYSDNSVYAEVGLKVGTHRIAALAHRMGITTPISTNPAMTIGGLKIGVTPLDMAHAYETIAHGGQRVGGSLGEPGMPVGIEEVTAAHRTLPDGHHRESDHTQLHRVLPPEVATSETEVLETVLQYGTAHSAAIGQFAAGKTGTTSNYGDAWFVGWDSKFTVAVWVGFPNSLVPMTTEFDGGPVLGGTFPALIWHNFMTAALHIEKQRVEEEAAKREAANGAKSPTSKSESTEAESGVSTSAPPAAQETTAPAAPTKAPAPSTHGERGEEPAAGGGKEGGAPAGAEQSPPASATPAPATPAPSTPPAATPTPTPAAPAAEAPKVSGGTGAPTGGAAPSG
ncbi:MAG TPA: transglycosylase domain-containing protein [Solirubrobacteraceae bacterium]